MFPATAAKSRAGAPTIRAPTSTSASGSRADEVRVEDDHDGEELVPDAVVVRLTDEALFQCPFIFMEDAGTARFRDLEVDAAAGVPAEGRLPVRLGLHGHVWRRDQFDEEIGRVLPRGSNPIVDLAA